MSNNSTITIACALCVGAAEEPYLRAALDAIAPAVDELVVNDNSGLMRSSSATVLAASAFAARGALHVRAHPFVDFADMRNRAFAGVATLGRPPDWMLFLDADEVHGEQIRYIAREILPRLPRHVGSVDAYTYHLYGSFRWMTDLARRFCFYRYSPDLRWRNAVHEKIQGLHGTSLVLPYRYYHYGNVIAPAALATKYERYFRLGNPVPRPPSPAHASIDIFLERAADVRSFYGTHPRAARPTIAALEAAHAETFALVDAGFRARRGAGMRVRATFRALNDSARATLRRVEHPGLYRAATDAR
jgi:hypothetical protein